MIQPSDSTKIKQHRGLGHGADYKPWILPQEFNSRGTTSYFPDWKHGRSISLLSQVEKNVYLTLRWDDRNLDIREQFPLELNRTVAIAQELGYRHPRNKEHQFTHMTTDFLVSTENGPYAVTVKPHLSSFDNKRVQQKYEIEKMYWESLGIELIKMTAEDLDPQLTENIYDVVEFYDIKWVSTDYHMIKHLIATKQLLVDMTKEIDYDKLVRQLKETRN